MPRNHRKKLKFISQYQDDELTHYLDYNFVEAIKNQDLKLIHDILTANPNLKLKDHYQFNALDYFIGHLNKNQIAEILVCFPEQFINIRDQNYQTALHWAAKNGKNFALKALVDAGADVNAKDKYDNTCLHFAAKQNHFKTIKILCENNASIEVVNLSSNTPIKIAARKNNIQAIGALIKAGAYFKGILDILWDSKDKQSLEKLFFNHTKSFRDVTNKNGQTILHWAAWKNDIRLAKKFIISGACDTNQKDYAGKTFLDWFPKSKSGYRNKQELITLVEEKIRPKMALAIEGAFSSIKINGIDIFPSLVSTIIAKHLSTSSIAIQEINLAANIGALNRRIEARFSEALENINYINATLAK